MRELLSDGTDVALFSRGGQAGEQIKPDGIIMAVRRRAVGELLKRSSAGFPQVALMEVM